MKFNQKYGRKWHLFGGPYRQEVRISFAADRVLVGCHDRIFKTFKMSVHPAPAVAGMADGLQSEARRKKQRFCYSAVKSKGLKRNF